MTIHHHKEFMAAELKVKIEDTRAQMGATAAIDIAIELRALLAKKDVVNMIFAAAPSQNEFLKTLSEQKDIPWERVNAFHMDEYIGLDSNAPQQFGNFLKEGIFDKLPFGKVFYIKGNAEEPGLECERYSNLLKQHPVDIVCMGIGENGHIAFNDPHVADFKDEALVKIVDLSEESRIQQVHDACFDILEDVPAAAITLTIPALLRAAIICCVVPGMHKAKAVYNTIYSEVDPQNPATILRTHKNATLYLDKESASQLKQEPIQ